jgi:putative OPT family oligopeptide transporter
MATPATSPVFAPYVPASQSPAEFTLKAIAIGIVFGLIFGASTVYLGLRAGLTVSASIPIAVLAISVLKRLGGSTILENNIVQTIGSAGESVAGGVVFTVPALIFLAPYGPGYFSYFQITMLAFAGGILGVLMMVPLRRALIVKEHGVLPYPEGAACADVLIAGERGGALAATVFKGLGVGAVWKALSWIVQIFRTAIGYSMARTSFFPNATLNVDISPEYMGVGYVIGPRIAGVMFAGGVLSWMVLLPLLTILGNYMPGPFPPVPASGLRISQMSAQQLWSAYIRYTGAGAVLAAGIITLARTIPTIIASFRDSVKDFGAGQQSGAKVRTERDIPIVVVLGGSLLLALFLAVAPKMPTQGNFLVSVLVIIFGFFFVTVSSRITGLIGSSSNPISGMTIATLIITCLIFVALGWTGDYYSPVALCVGAIVCVAAANAGATSQDLKTGFLVGATPRRQQIGFIIGVLTSTLVIGGTLFLLDRTYAMGEAHGIGGPKMPAPQATLMATIIKGLLAQNLPWAPVLVGVFLAFMAQMAGAHALSWAVGAYLPLSTTFPIWIGGMMKAFSDSIRRKKEGAVGEESELSSGMLYSTGLVAGGSLGGVLIALVAFVGDAVLHWEKPTIQQKFDLGEKFYSAFKNGVGGNILAAIAFGVLCVLLVRNARKKLEA